MAKPGIQPRNEKERQLWSNMKSKRRNESAVDKRKGVAKKMGRKGMSGEAMNALKKHDLGAFVKSHYPEK